MGTRARIAIENDDGSYESIYLHWNGHPNGGAGETLRDHYTDPAKVRELIALGNLSLLGDEIGEAHDFDSRWSGEKVCTAYARDRGETGQEADRCASLKDLCRLTKETGGEWLYVFKGGEWLGRQGGMSAFGNPASKEPDAALKTIDELIKDLA